MFVPWAMIGGATLLLLVISVIAIISIFAWFGIAREHEELLGRVKVMQIDVIDLQQPMRRLALDREDRPS